MAIPTTFLVRSCLSETWLAWSHFITANIAIDLRGAACFLRDLRKRLQRSLASCGRLILLLCFGDLPLPSWTFRSHTTAVLRHRARVRRRRMLFEIENKFRLSAEQRVRLFVIRNGCFPCSLKSCVVVECNMNNCYTVVEWKWSTSLEGLSLCTLGKP